MPALCVCAAPCPCPRPADCGRLRDCEADCGRDRDGTGEVEVRCGGGGVSARGSSWLHARQLVGSIALALSRRFCAAEGSCNSRTCESTNSSSATRSRGARVLTSAVTASRPWATSDSRSSLSTE
eukprot:scaffold27024_cov63-Phaeocystis_antarctica.AAC.1